MVHDPAGAIEAVEGALTHRFEDPELLRRALIHRSYAAEEGVPESYERLEFLGDAVLQLSITHHLFNEYPELSEGEMAKVRAAVVNERTLADLARRMNLGSLVLLGRGEELTGGADKDSILADVIESLLGAIYLEAGFEATRSIIMNLWLPLVSDRATSPGEADYKTRLQEILARQGVRPRYVIAEDGPEHAKVFSAQVFADGQLLGRGEGTSKKRAEQAAAAAAAESLAE